MKFRSRCSSKCAFEWGGLGGQPSLSRLVRRCQSASNIPRYTAQSRKRPLSASGIFGVAFSINSPNEDNFTRSERELLYHCEDLDRMKLDVSAKFQIHIGGVYNDKEKSTKRFIDRFYKLNPIIKKRLVIENDDKSYNIGDCLVIHKKTKIPILFDMFHHVLNPIDLPLQEIFGLVRKTWKRKDGLPMVDYSFQKKGGRPGQHAENIDVRSFKKFIQSTQGYDFDIMLEIKDKEKSALKAIKIVSGSSLFVLPG